MNETEDRITCPTGRCGVQPVRIIGNGRYCKKCLVRLGPVGQTSFERHMREVEEFTANRQAETDTVSGATLLADPPLPTKLRPLLDIVSELHTLTHELAERLAKA